RARNFDIEKAAGGKRQFVLRDLVALGQVRVEIVFAGKARTLMDGAVQGERGAHSHFDGALVENGKSAGETEAHGANVGVRWIAETRGAAAEDFCFGEKLNVDFETDDGLVFREDFGRDGHGLWSGFEHKKPTLYNQLLSLKRRTSRTAC